MGQRRGTSVHAYEVRPRKDHRGVSGPGNLNDEKSRKAKRLPLPGTTLKSHPVPQRHAFYNQMKKNGQVPLPHRVMDDAAAAMKQMELYCIAHPGSPLSSTIYSWQALGRVARTECGRRNSRYRSHCCGGASRIRRAIFGWPAAAERGDQASSVISSASTPAG